MLESTEIKRDMLWKPFHVKERLLRLSIRLGLKTAFKLAIVARLTRRIICIRLKPFERPFFVRGRTSDDTVVELVFGNNEGSEREVFQKNFTDWIRKVAVIHVELHEHYSPGCGKAFFRAIEELDYRVSVCGESIIIYLNNEYMNNKEKSIEFNGMITETNNES